MGVLIIESRVLTVKFPLPIQSSLDITLRRMFVSDRLLKTVKLPIKFTCFFYLNVGVAGQSLTKSVFFVILLVLENGGKSK